LEAYIILILKRMLCSEPIMAHPRSGRTYFLIVDASTGIETVEERMGLILIQIDKDGKYSYK
jgi:hypothetical protein